MPSLRSQLATLAVVAAISCAHASSVPAKAVVAYVFPENNVLQPGPDRRSRPDPYQLCVCQYRQWAHGCRFCRRPAEFRLSRVAQAAEPRSDGPRFGGRMALVDQLLRYGAHSREPDRVHPERHGLSRAIPTRRPRYRLGISRHARRRPSVPQRRQAEFHPVAQGTARAVSRGDGQNPQAPLPHVCCRSVGRIPRQYRNGKSTAVCRYGEPDGLRLLRTGFRPR